MTVNIKVNERVISLAFRMKFWHGFGHERVQKFESALYLSTAKKGLSTDESRQSSGCLALCISVDSRKGSVDRSTQSRNLKFCQIHERVQKFESALYLSTAKKGLSTDESRQSSGCLALCVSIDSRKGSVDRSTQSRNLKFCQTCACRQI
ncbi:hypothetical protein Taro_013536 [Colocasia esculenta]|uniref:Uncharacterized protein n=1 Tax=Colocasia esculenta TaxID=4460 RepID=A0A843UG94_COLES|nr:hypothetical protein [Colocasia esculenta]